MTQPRHPGGAVLVGILAAIAISVGACDGNPHDSEIVATIEGVWRAAAVDPADAYLRSYQRHTHENATVCQHLPIRDRWYADRLGLPPSNITPQDQIYDGALAYLEAEASLSSVTSRGLQKCSRWRYGR